ncbi:MAG: Holliday junction resolvase RuvX [Firmicutes bacterium]|nr:Holliday junction resolvase RuvX [Bacillota bacterium]
MKEKKCERRIMALDLGDKKIGVAVSDPMKITAQSLTTLTREGWAKDLAKIRDLVEKYNVSEIIIGLPLNMNGSAGSTAQQYMKFARRLSRALNIKIITQDERLTSLQANRVLLQGKVKRAKRKKLVDKVAASYILESYLSQRKN